tara:strand:+ start:505 stop:1044 length:540 start_codon:yes stop_codon:yes gene_type:complete
METFTALPSNFSLTLRPNRSLSQRGFLWLMAVFGGASFALGGYFWLLGAWPVFGFFGLDVVLLYFFFRLNYRYARRYETLAMRDGKLIFGQVSATGLSREWSFDPYWVRPKLERLGQDGEDIGNLILSSHGKYVSVGAFLSPDERAELAARLQLSLKQIINAGPAPQGDEASPDYGQRA